jgi:transglutaminase-like putative cysteine protease
MSFPRAPRGLATILPFLVLAWTTALVHAFSGQPTADYDRYYAVIMENARSGWMHATQTTVGDRITTIRDMNFTFRRGDSTTTAGMTTTFVETAAGKPISMRSTQRLGETPVIVDYTFHETDVEVTTDPDGARKITRAPLPEVTWLTPRGASELLTRRIKAGAQEVTYTTLDPLTGLAPVSMTHSKIRKASRVIAGSPRDGTLMLTRASNSQGAKSEEFLDENGALIQQVSTMSGLECIIEIAGPEVLESAARAPELMISTFVKPDRPIRNARKSTRATFTLGYGDHEAPIIPETGSQTMASMGVDQLDVVIDTGFPNAAPADDRKNPAFLESSVMITRDDEGVRKLAERAVKGIDEKDVLKRARALCRAVHDHVTGKSLDVLFATAADVARTKSGDCTEHAVLLAAVLRSQNIPSRVVSGLIYADSFIGSEDIFGYHMWTQALIEIDGTDRWVDLDATLRDHPMYDATHIALDLQTLSDGHGMEENSGMAAALGRLTIKVVSIEHGK